MPDLASPFQVCGVELERMRYVEETDGWATERRRIQRLVRHWNTEEPRCREWADVAPIPLTLEQARATLESPQEHTYQGVVTVFSDVGDGTLSYAFDAQGRTKSTHWDPQADSSDYRYHYAHDCPTGVDPADLPRYVD